MKKWLNLAHCLLVMASFLYGIVFLPLPFFVSGPGAGFFAIAWITIYLLSLVLVLPINIWFLARYKRVTKFEKILGYIAFATALAWFIPLLLMIVTFGSNLGDVPQIFLGGLSLVL